MIKYNKWFISFIKLINNINFLIVDSKDYEKAEENKSKNDDKDGANTFAISLIVNIILAVIAGAVLI